MDSGSTLLPPTNLPPVDPDPPEDDDFDAQVPRPATAWGVYVPQAPGQPAGFYAEGYMVPDLFPTAGDALTFIRRGGDRLAHAFGVPVEVSAATLAQLQAT